MRKLKLLFAALALLVGGVGSASAETDYTSNMPTDWTGSGGDFQGGRELYNGDKNNIAVGKVMYQSFEAPVAGIYEIKFYAVTSCTAERYGDVTPLYGNNIAQAYATAGTNKATVAMEVINQTGCTLVQDANIRTLSVEAAAGETIEYGIENIAEGGNWYTIKGLSAKMKTVAEIFQAQYDEAYAIWQYSTENETGARATFKTYVDALNTALTGTLAEAQTASDNLAAALITYESKSYPVKGHGVKYDFTSKMNMAINAWTCKQGNGPAQYGYTGATETYNVNAAGEVMYQTITGLANGEYEIHFYAVANAANGGGTASEASAKKAYVYANDQTEDIAVIEQNSCTPSKYERTFTVLVKDGTLKYGITNNEAAGNWYICKNVALYMTGAPDLSDYYDAIAEKLTTANGLKSSPMNATTLSDLNGAIDATDGYQSITIIGTLETLSANLTTAITAANTSIANYEDAFAVLDAASAFDAAGKASYAANETVAAIQAAYDARSLEAVTSEQKTACATALSTAVRAQTSENSDWTAALVNPSFESDFASGWTNKGMARQNNASFAKTGTYYAEKWEPNGTFSVKQTVADIPAGIYSISAKALARSVTSAKLFAADSEEAITIEDAAGDYTVEFLQEADGDLTIGFEGVGDGTGASWLCVDNFTMKFVRAATTADYKVALNTAIANANTIITASANVGTGVFQIPTSAQETLSSAKATAQGVYDNGSATISEVKTATKDMNDAIDAYNNTTLNVPSASTHYNLVVATSDHAKKGNAVIIVPGTTSANNPTGYGLNANFAINSNLAQAITFTQVSGNTYNISFETADGTAYLTYGTTNGSAAGWSDSQIQATTDATKKGEFKIVATTTDKVFNIHNTLTNSTIACQTGGNIYTEAGNANFTISEAAQASVSINIATAVKYGTRIFPFTPVLPAGVKAYTCAEAPEGILTLAEVATPEANKPYILEAESGYSGDALTGWGIAGATTVTEGLLTGVYADTKATKDTYVLQNKNDVVAFYKVAEGSEPTVGANHCYLTAPASARNAFFFDGEATAINTIEALTSGKCTIFNANGAKVPALQKGVNILKTDDGQVRKVIVK